MRRAVALAIAVGIGCAATESSQPPIKAPAPVAASSGEREMGPTSELPETPSAAPVESATPVASVEPPKPVCTPQEPFEFLVRKNYIPVKTRKKEHQKALEFRTKTYGSVKGVASGDAAPAKDKAVQITLFGLPVTVHEKIVPALRCAEAEVKASCASTPYTPHALAGIRDHNTYRAGEVTNHMWGIALDIDPMENSCCGCVEKWKKSPLCKKKAKTIWERMAMPKCWVDAFEKYGFYWLGHDKLMDTMHFEFLGDPEKVMTVPSPQLATSP
ncbi:MAG: M15 family metallopeptidase [Polyangiales bacterium]